MSQAASIGKRFGPTALDTPANRVTILRILVTIPTLWLLWSRSTSWLLTVLWFSITVADSLDGWMARRDGSTHSGAWLDHTADKISVIGGLGILAIHGILPWLPVLLIAAREITITLYRTVAKRFGVQLKSVWLGKRKAFTQYCAIGWVVLPLTAHCRWLQIGWLWLVVVMTLASGVEIVYRSRREWFPWPV